MRRFLMVAATTAACTGANAQSNVTIFGVMDAAFQRVTSHGTASVNRLISSGYQTSRFGVRGTEDLGGGLSAGFWIEAGLNLDDGTGLTTNTNNQTSGATTGGGLTWNRRATVQLAGPFGEVRLGRDYVPGIWNILLFDPFVNIGVGASQSYNSSIVGPTLLRASNSIGYLTPKNLGGFYANASYWLGENPSNAANKNDGTGGGIRVGYASGPAEIALSLNRTDKVGGDIHQNNIAASWNFGVVKIMGTIERDRNGVLRGRGGDIGAIAPIGLAELKLAWSTYEIRNGITSPKANKLTVGYGYNLSKRTTLYATAAKVTNMGGAVLPAAPGTPAPLINRSSSGFDLGIRHVF